jgi:bifunctional enzyme CysN/CysC
VTSEVVPGGATVWFTGLSGAGKSTLSTALAGLLAERRRCCFGLDGDDLRGGLNTDLAFGRDDRSESVRRAGEVALLLAKTGHISLVSLIAPYSAERKLVRERHDLSAVPFLLVFVATPLDVCEHRDPKGLYARARRGEIATFTGVSDPYEAPDDAEVIVHAEIGTPAAGAREVLDVLERRGLV